MSFSPLVGVGTLVFTFVNFLSYLKSKNWNGVLTQIIAWGAGIGGIWIASLTQFAPQIKFGTHTLASMDSGTKIFIGLIATSILSTVNEVKKAIDNSDSAKKAPLFGSGISGILSEVTHLGGQAAAPPGGSAGPVGPAT